MAFSDEMKMRYIAQGITAAILAGSKPVLPEDPTVKFLTMREYAGRSPVKIHNTAPATEYARPSLQVVAHAANKVDARALAYQAYNASSFVNTTIGTTRYIIVNPIQEPFDFGLDSKGRVQFAFNVEFLKTPS